MSESTRSPGQQTITVSLSEELLALVDKKRGYIPRSVFIRSAVVDHLRAQGMHVTEEMIAAPDRAGKGGRKSPSARGVGMNEKKVRYKA